MSDLELLVALIAEAERRDYMERMVPKMEASLGPRQLELFRGWQLRCVKLGVPVTPEEKFDYLSELTEAA